MIDATTRFGSAQEAATYLAHAAVHQPDLYATALTLAIQRSDPQNRGWLADELDRFETETSSAGPSDQIPGGANSTMPTASMPARPHEEAAPTDAAPVMTFPGAGSDGPAEGLNPRPRKPAPPAMSGSVRPVEGRNVLEALIGVLETLTANAAAGAADGIKAGFYEELCKRCGRQDGAAEITSQPVARSPRGPVSSPDEAFLPDGGATRPAELARSGQSDDRSNPRGGSGGLKEWGEQSRLFLQGYRQDDPDMMRRGLGGMLAEIEPLQNSPNMNTPAPRSAHAPSPAAQEPVGAGRIGPEQTGAEPAAGAGQAAHDAIRAGGAFLLGPKDQPDAVVRRLGALEATELQRMRTDTMASIEARQGPDVSERALREMAERGLHYLDREMERRGLLDPAPRSAKRSRARGIEL